MERILNQGNRNLAAASEGYERNPPTAINRGQAAPALFSQALSNTATAGRPARADAPPAGIPPPPPPPQNQDLLLSLIGKIDTLTRALVATLAALIDLPEKAALLKPIITELNNSLSMESRPLASARFRSPSISRCNSSTKRAADGARAGHVSRLSQQ